MKKVLTLVKKEEYDLVIKNPTSNLRLPLYYISEEAPIMNPVKKKKRGYTLNQLGSKLDRIGDLVMALTRDVKILKEDVRVLKQDVKNINTRLDYIVVANNLKDLPKTNS